MIRTLFFFPLLCAISLFAQFETPNSSIRGEVKGLVSGAGTTYLIEAYDSSSHLRVGQTLVSSNGDFEFETLPRGNYELRLVAANGQALMTQYISPNAAMQTVTFEIPGPQRQPGPATGAVDVAQLGHRVDPRALRVFQKAVKAIARDDHNESIQLLKKAIEIDSAYAEAHLELAIQYGRAGDAGRSLEESETAVRLDPGNGLARLNLGIVLFRMNRLKDAETEARAATRLVPQNTKAAFLTGAILVGEGKITPETLAYLKKAYPDYPKARELGARLEKQLARSFVEP